MQLIALLTKTSVINHLSTWHLDLEPSLKIRPPQLSQTHFSTNSQSTQMLVFCEDSQGYILRFKTSHCHATLRAKFVKIGEAIQKGQLLK